MPKVMNVAQKICLKLHILQKKTLVPLDSRAGEKALQGIKTRGDTAFLLKICVGLRLRSQHLEAPPFPSYGLCLLLIFPFFSVF